MTKEDTERFSGAKLRLARMFHGWTQAELASRVDVSKVFISLLESDHKQPTDILADALADALGFEAEFFFAPLKDEFRDEECHFRRRQATPLALRNRVLAHGTLFGMIVSYLDDEVSLPEVNIPEPNSPVQNREDIERVAEKCRRTWNLGLDAPITNMIRVLEWAGVVVTRLGFDGHAEKVDAFSRSGMRNVVVLNTHKNSSSRSVFDAAHECGHLVMHVGLETGTPALEEQAHQFASAFLLPRVGFLRECPRFISNIDWQVIFALKSRWRVSAAAIIRRAYDLKLMDAVLYQRANKYLHFKGWDKGEPGEFPREESELVKTALDALAESGISAFDVARQLHLKPEVFERITGLSANPPEPEPEPEPEPREAKILSFESMRAKRSGADSGAE